jgi:uncharacterized membrane protein
MSEVESSSVENQPMTAKDEAAKTNAMIAYILMALGMFTGLFWFVGAIWAMLKKSDAKGTIFEDHYSNITKTFWWGLGFGILGSILLFVLIGYFVLMVVWIWSVFKIVKGLVQISSNKSYSGN